MLHNLALKALQASCLLGKVGKLPVVVHIEGRLR
jgi:hypothetical protein